MLNIRADTNPTNAQIKSDPKIELSTKTSDQVVVNPERL